MDALCKRYGISNDHRTLHGALLDSEILAQVYLAMTGGQTKLNLDNNNHASTDSMQFDLSDLPSLKSVKPNDLELKAHTEWLAKQSTEDITFLWDKLK